MRKFINLAEALNPSHVGPVQVTAVIYFDHLLRGSMEFNCIPWLEQAPDNELIEFAESGFDAGTMAALGMAELDPEVAEAVELVYNQEEYQPAKGFCTINFREAQAWFNHFRPDIWKYNLTEALQPRHLAPVRIEAVLRNAVDEDDFLEFDALPWFEQADEQQLRGFLLDDPYHGSVYSDWVRIWAIGNVEGAAEFDKRCLYATDCEVNSTDAMSWIHVHHPNLVTFDQITSHVDDEDDNDGEWDIIAEGLNTKHVGPYEVIACVYDKSLRRLASYNAIPWLETATDEQLEKVYRENWDARDSAKFAAKTDRFVERALWTVGGTVCLFDAEEMAAWIKFNRPALYPQYSGLLEGLSPKVLAPSRVTGEVVEGNWYLTFDLLPWMMRASDRELKRLCSEGNRDFQLERAASWIAWEADLNNELRRLLTNAMNPAFDIIDKHSLWSWLHINRPEVFKWAQLHANAPYL